MSKVGEKVRIGQLLVKAGVLTQGQLEEKLAVAKTIGQPLGQILLQSGLLTRYQLICTIQLQSLILDQRLSKPAGVKALRLVCLEGHDLGEACKRVGLADERVWSRKLGDFLVGANIISTRQLLDAIAASFQTCTPLGQTLVLARLVRPEVIATALTLQRQVRAGELALEQALQDLEDYHAAAGGGVSTNSRMEVGLASIKTPVEITGEFEVGTMQQVDQILWKRIRRTRFEDQALETNGLPQQFAQDLVGTSLAERYEVISFIGSGGMGLVYLVRDKQLDSVMALKMMQPRHKRDPEIIMRFKQEAQLVRSLNHENVVVVHDVGITDQGCFYLIMDYISGISLAELISQQGKVPLDRALSIFHQSCSAVAHAHERGIIHRDLKPSNIMLARNEGEPDAVKIVDFGIAKLAPPEGGPDFQITRSGQLFGSPLYMSPERCMGKPLDARSDIYSIGCVMYEALTGRPPFVGATVYEIFYKHMQQKLERIGKVAADPQVSVGMEDIVFTCMAKDPSQRYQSMSDLLESLERVRASAAGGQQRRGNGNG